MELDDDAGVSDPGRDWIHRAVDRRLRPWVDWFGVGRLLGSFAAVVVVILGGWWLLRAPAPPTEARLPYAAGAGVTTTSGSAGTAGASPGATSPTSTIPTTLVVHVAGAVAAPGVYELPVGARVHDAVDAAGGASARADPAAINLAAPVVDGERVYVALVGESPPPVVAGSPPAGSAAPAGPVDLNHATAEQLDELPGVGPATAAAIVQHRAEHGPFATVEDLDAVSGIGPAKLEALRELVTT